MGVKTDKKSHPKNGDRSRSYADWLSRLACGSGQESSTIRLNSTTGVASFALSEKGGESFTVTVKLRRTRQTRKAKR